jgi:hypothetical protein
MGIRCADHVTPSTRKSRHYFADSSGHSVGIVRLRTKATELSVFNHELQTLCQVSSLLQTLIITSQMPEAILTSLEKYFGSATFSRLLSTFL